MKTRSAREIVKLINAGGQPCSLVGDPRLLIGPDVVLDSRQVKKGSLFVALPGENVDGHDYVDSAVLQGAAAVIVTHQMDTPAVQFICSDAQLGLAALARSLHAEARTLGLRTVAITGSSGKTSTKDLLAQIFCLAGSAVAPENSRNNEVGVPLTVCEINEETEYLISEMGSRGIGNIDYLCSIVHPSAAVVINVGEAHLGQFGSKEITAQAKGEIIEALDADGWAVLNADDPLVAAMRSRSKGHIAGFCVAQPDQPSHDLVDAEIMVSAENLEADDLDRFSFTLVVSRQGVERIERADVALQVVGMHQVADATAAATAALALDVDLCSVAAALNQATAVSQWRMELHELANGALVINDAYNGNPDSMAAALHATAVIGGKRRLAHPDGRMIGVLGDMLELGPASEQLHEEVGRLAGELGFDYVFAIGDYAEHVVCGAESAGIPAQPADVAEVAGLLELKPGDVVIVKASRGLELEKVAEQLVGGEE